MREVSSPVRDGIRDDASMAGPSVTPAREGLGIVILDDEFYLKIPGQEALVGPIPKFELEDILDARENANG